VRFHRSIIVIGIISILVISSSTKNLAINTNEIPDHLSKINDVLPVNIKLWGYNNQFQELLNQSLFQQLVEESYYPKQNTTDIWSSQVTETSYGMKIKFNISIESSTQEEFANFYDYVTNHTSLRTVKSPLNASQSLHGMEIPADSLNSYFSKYKLNDMYQIHLTNLTRLDNLTSEQYHWITPGLPNTNIFREPDLRSLHNLRYRQILFDPTAIAPLFGIEPSITKFNLNQQVNFTATGVNSILEQIIAGSPLSYNYMPLESEIHIARIVITTDSNDIIYNNIARDEAFTIFSSQVKKIFSAFNLEMSFKNVNLNDLQSLASYLEQRTKQIDGKNAVIVDGGFAETFKDQVRRNYYREFPSRYYYGLFLFADPSRYYLQKIQSNSNEPLYQEYNVGEIGFSMDSLLPLYNQTSSVGIVGAIKESFYVFGRNFGLPILNSNFTMQLDSPMSPITPSTDWNFNLNQFEVDQIQRRYALAFREKQQLEINDVIDKTHQLLYSWIDTSELNQYKQVLNLVDQRIKELNYTGALNILLKDSNQLEFSIEKVQRGINTVNYGSVLLMVVLWLTYFSYVLQDESISKEELKTRMEENRKYHANKRDNRLN